MPSQSIKPPGAYIKSQAFIHGYKAITGNTMRLIRAF